MPVVDGVELEGQSPFADHVLRYGALCGSPRASPPAADPIFIGAGGGSAPAAAGRIWRPQRWWPAPMPTVEAARGSWPMRSQRKNVMNRRNILTISSITACAALGGAAAWMLNSPNNTPSERIQVTTVGQGPATSPMGAPGGPGRPGGRPGGPPPERSRGRWSCGSGAPDGKGRTQTSAPPAMVSPAESPGNGPKEGRRGTRRFAKAESLKALPNKKGFDPFYINSDQSSTAPGSLYGVGTDLSHGAAGSSADCGQTVYRSEEAVAQSLRHHERRRDRVRSSNCRWASL